MTFLSTDRRATLPAGSAFTPDDRGEKTFVLRFRTSGTITLTIQVGDLSIKTAVVTVSAAAATRLELAGLPTARAGDAFVVTATARDEFGNVADGFGGLATFLSDDHNSTLPSGKSFTGTDAGVKLFLLTFRTAGPRSVTLGAGGLTSTLALSVAPGALNHFVLAAPDSVNEFAPFSLVARAFDAFGNVVTDYAGTVAITSDDPQAVLPAPVLFPAADAGTHTFSGLVFRKPASLHVLW